MRREMGRASRLARFFVILGASRVTCSNLLQGRLLSLVAGAVAVDVGQRALVIQRPSCAADYNLASSLISMIVFINAGVKRPDPRAFGLLVQVSIVCLFLSCMSLSGDSRRRKSSVTPEQLLKRHSLVVNRCAAA